MPNIVQKRSSKNSGTMLWYVAASPEDDSPPTALSLKCTRNMPSSAMPRRMSNTPMRSPGCAGAVARIPEALEAPPAVDDMRRWVREHVDPLTTMNPPSASAKKTPGVRLGNLPDRPVTLIASRREASPPECPRDQAPQRLPQREAAGVAGLTDRQLPVVTLRHAPRVPDLDDLVPEDRVVALAGRSGLFGNRRMTRLPPRDALRFVGLG